MGLVDRAKNIIVTPKTEWDVIAAETTPDMQVITGYVLPLAAIAAIAGFIGTAFLGSMFGVMRLSMVWGLVAAIVSIVMAVVMCYVVAFIIDALAPSFGGQKSFSQALKVAVYSFTPVWVLSILKIIPFLGVIVLLGAIYAIYLLYLGLPRLMRAPAEKAAGYTAVVVIIAVVVGIVLGMITGAIAGMGMVGTSALVPRAAVSYDRDSAVAKLDALSRKMEEANKRMEVAQKSGDPNKQMEAALAAMGTALSGGKGVEPLQLDQLKPMVPDRLGDLPRTDLRTDRSGVQGFMVAKAEATYADPSGKRVALEVTDTGGMAGLMGFAAWINVQGEHEDSSRREVTRKEGARLVHEEVSKQGGRNKYTVVVGERFVVSAEGSNVDLGTLKSAVNAVDLGKLESLAGATAKG